jgi:hypothetical protein
VRRSSRRRRREPAATTRIRARRSPGSASRGSSPGRGSSTGPGTSWTAWGGRASWRPHAPWPRRRTWTPGAGARRSSSSSQESLAGLLEPLAAQYRIVLVPVRGQAGGAYLVNDVRPYVERGHTEVLYVGDFDKAGADIETSARERLETHSGRTLTWTRLALALSPGPHGGRPASGGRPNRSGCSDRGGAKSFLSAGGGDRRGASASRRRISASVAVRRWRRAASVSLMPTRPAGCGRTPRRSTGQPVLERGRRLAAALR